MKENNNVNLEKEIYRQLGKLSKKINIIGKNSSGKTNVLMSLMRESIKKGESVIYIAPNPRNEIISKIFDYAIESDRQSDIEYISPFEPEQSLKFNPLYKKTIEEIAGHISSLSSNTEDYYMVSIYKVTDLILSALSLIDKVTEGEKRFSFTYRDIYNNISVENIEGLLMGVEAIECGEDFKLMEVKHTFIEKINEYLEYDDSHHYKIELEMKKILEKVSKGNEGIIFCSERENILEEKMKESKIIIIPVYILENKGNSVFFIKPILEAIRKVKENITFFIEDGKDILSPRQNFIFNPQYRTIITSIKSNKNRETYTSIKENAGTTIETIEDKGNYKIIIDDKAELKVEEIEDSNYIFDRENIYSEEIPELYKDYCKEVKNKGYQRLVKSCLEDLISLKFEEDTSIKEHSKDKKDTKFKTLLKIKGLFGINYREFKNVSLKRHILNNFKVALVKYKNISEDSWKEEMNIPLITTLIINFKESYEILEGYKGSEEKKEFILNEYLKYKLYEVSLEDIDNQLLDELNYLINNQFFTTNKSKKDKKVSFVATTEIKTRQIELILKKEDLNINSAKDFKDILKRESSKKDIEKEKVTQENEENKETLKIEDNRVSIIKKAVIVDVFSKNKISNISFSKINKIKEFEYAIIFMDNGKVINLNLIDSETKKQLITLI